jgi:hypothetical protein
MDLFVEWAKPLIPVIFRFEIGEGSVSRFMSNAFEYGDALLFRPEGADSEDGETS